MGSGRHEPSWDVGAGLVDGRGDALRAPYVGEGGVAAALAKTLLLVLMVLITGHESWLAVEGSTPGRGGYYGFCLARVARVGASSWVVGGASLDH